MTPEIFNELCSYAVDTKKDGVGSFSVLLPCNLLNYLVTGQRICLDHGEQVPVVLPQVEHFIPLLLNVARGVVLGCVLSLMPPLLLCLWSLPGAIGETCLRWCLFPIAFVLMRCCLFSTWEEGGNLDD